LRRPTWLEALLLVAMAVALTAVLVRDGGPVPAAYAGGGGGANANGVIALTAQNVGNNRAELLYLIDTSRHSLCVYGWDGTHLGLVGARYYDYDLEVSDSSGDKVVEGPGGAPRGYIKAFVENERKKKELQPPK
jgi:hypothetical protein